MHENELWQAYDKNGERLDTPGYDATLDNPENGSGQPFVGTVSVWLYRLSDGGVEILSQQRAPQLNNGGKWDVSAGGHIDNGERMTDAMVREAEEEIGAKIDPERLEFILRMRGIHKKQMFNNYFLYDWTGREDEFHFDDGEVSQVKWVKLADFDEFVDQNVKDPIKKNRFMREIFKYWLERKQEGGDTAE